ncbi:hypothetical protein [Burkholderia lata]|uniref:hypothetical protein n=1 Tax=Burkholderia lata (strain ATCC 17760 / DSM 23089 / LMG 22485 / NCIMB 9086 / R18194 / 383) TaxID=482957 RepID=UPI00158381CB|nr:hypothetical protein [Burkholderia lata]
MQQNGTGPTPPSSTILIPASGPFALCILIVSMSVLFSFGAPGIVRAARGRHRVIIDPAT